MDELADQCCSYNKKSFKIINNDDCCGSLPAISEVEAKNDSCCSTNAVEKNDKDLTDNSHCCSNDPNENDEKLSSCCGSGDEIFENKTTCCDNTANEIKINNQAPVKENKTEFYIKGMDCPSCASTIEKGISSLADVQEAKVVYNTAKLQIVGSNALSLDYVENEVQKLGFTAELIQPNKNMRTYNVIGMDCSSCAQSIEKHLNTVPAVKDVQVNFSTGKMKVDHENTVDDIITEVAKLGFDTFPMTPGKKSTAPKSNKTGYRLITLSGILIAIGFIGSYSGFPILLGNFLYAIAIIISGYKPVKSAYFAIKSRSLDMNVLMSAAAIGAAIIGE